MSIFSKSRNITNKFNRKIVTGGVVLVCSVVIIFADRFGFSPVLKTAYEMGSKVFVDKRLDQTDTDAWNLNLDASDLKILSEPFVGMLKEERTFLLDEEKKWVKADVNLDGQRYKNIKIKINGTSATPFKNSLSDIYGWKVKLSGTNVYDPSKVNYSYKLKLKSDKLHKGIRRYTLNTAGDQWDASTMALTDIARKFGLISSSVKLKHVYINNVDGGIFLLSEDIGKELLERDFQITNYGMYKSNDEWDKSLNKKHTSFTDYTYQDKEQAGMSPATELGLTKLKELFEALEQQRVEDLHSLVDVDYFAKLSALELLYGNTHSSIGDNVKYIYNFANGLFYTTFRVEGSIKKTKSPSDALEFEESAEYRHDRHKVVRLLSSDPVWRQLRNSYLKQILHDRDEIIRLIQSYARELSEKSKLTTKIMWPKLESSERAVEHAQHNLKNISNYLKNYSTDDLEIDFAKNRVSTFGKITKKELKRVKKRKGNAVDVFAKIYVTWNSSTRQAEVLHVSHSASEIVAFLNCDGDTIKPEKQIILPATLGTKSQNFINLNLTGVECLQALKVRKFGVEVAERHVHVNKRTETNYNIMHFDEFNDIFNGAKELTIDNEVTWLIPAGSYFVDRAVMLPKNVSLKIDPGTQIFIAEDLSIFVRGNLTALGTENMPITVDRWKDKNFGSFAVLGQNKDVTVRLENFHLKNGSEAILDGVYFSSQMSIHHSNANISYSSFSNSSSDDGLNIKNSDITMVQNAFYDNFGDQVDLDYCQGVVARNSFFMSESLAAQDSETDGLDVSGTKVTVTNNRFSNLSDKAVSVGEKSNISLEHNVIQSSNLGVAVKDGSKAAVNNNQLINNEIDMISYIKKHMYSDPSFSGGYDRVCIPKKPDYLNERLYRSIGSIGSYNTRLFEISDQCSENYQGG